MLLNVDRLGDPETAKQEQRAFLFKFLALLLGTMAVSFGVTLLLLI